MAARRHSTPIPTFPLEGGRSHSLAPVSSRTPGVDRGLGCSWEDLPAQRLQRRLARDASDLFVFKANYRGAALAAGPIHPGLRISATDELFRIGNAAGEAHTILGEGMSMALQSGAVGFFGRIGNRLPALLDQLGADVGAADGFDEFGVEPINDRLGRARRRIGRHIAC